MKINKTRMALLKELRNDARKSLSEMSRSTSVPITTVFDNYNKLVDGKVIVKHSSVVDFRMLGFNYRSFLFLKAKDSDELADFLSSHVSVNSVFRISDYDYLVDCIFPGVKEFYELIDSLRDVGASEIEAHDVIEQLKYEEFLL